MKLAFKLLKSLPVQLVICIIAAFFLGDILELQKVQFFYTLSIIFKEILMAILPVIIFSYISGAILALEQKAPLLILSIIGLVVVSNAVGVNIAYFISKAVLPNITTQGAATVSQATEGITPLIDFAIPDLVSPDQAMLAGVIIGLVFSTFRRPAVNHMAHQLRHYVTLFLQKVFIPFLPIYVFGFVLKIQRDGALESLIQNYAQVFLFFCISMVTYVCLLYWIGAGFNFRKAIAAMKNMLPAGITGFSTMSSAATMPITLDASEKNLNNPQFAQLVIPTTANIHLIADSLINPMLAMAVLILMGQPIPTWETYALFTGYYCLARFSTAAVPGGGIIVLLPYFKSLFNMSPEAASLITTIYILQDPIVTAGNVMGNGAFAMICNRLTKPFQKGKEPEAEAKLDDAASMY